MECTPVWPSYLRDLFWLVNRCMSMFGGYNKLLIPPPHTTLLVAKLKKKKQIKWKELFFLYFWNVSRQPNVSYTIKYYQQVFLSIEIEIKLSLEPPNEDSIYCRLHTRRISTPQSVYVCKWSFTRMCFL